MININHFHSCESKIFISKGNLKRGKIWDLEIAEMSGRVVMERTCGANSRVGGAEDRTLKILRHGCY